MPYKELMRQIKVEQKLNEELRKYRESAKKNL